MVVIVTRPASAVNACSIESSSRDTARCWWPAFDIGAAPDASNVRAQHWPGWPTTTSRSFVSANAVRAAQSLLSGAWPPGTMIGAVGASTRAAIEAELKPASELGGVGAG